MASCKQSSMASEPDCAGMRWSHSPNRAEAASQRRRGALTRRRLWLGTWAAGCMTPVSMLSMLSTVVGLQERRDAHCDARESLSNAKDPEAAFGLWTGFIGVESIWKTWRANLLQSAPRPPRVQSRATAELLVFAASGNQHWKRRASQLINSASARDRTSRPCWFPAGPFAGGMCVSSQAKRVSSAILRRKRDNRTEPRRLHVSSRRVVEEQTEMNESKPQAPSPWRIGGLMMAMG
jgi:hypothetical protein